MTKAQLKGYRALTKECKQLEALIERTRARLEAARRPRVDGMPISLAGAT